MSSPSFGPMGDFMGRVRKLGQMVQHPLDAVGSMIHDQQPTPHDQAVQQMNQDMNAHRNDAANASFAHPAPKIEEQKRPLKVK